ncbi:hypothetical protein A3D80_03825 [Candidatus Roizmanbacteria bacterium RIFCSPHIGHO2_02_FULL_40_13b]|nr:MAG: hypothetical protein A3D80_03825 [Candidatus Roizmanbacteria bacterium RIFCSPHIGHO2_02_FULL_40_13b]
MRLVFEDEHSRAIKTKEKIKFHSFSSYYLIIITARVKSEKQLGDQTTDDEDLTVKIDGKLFPKLQSSALIDSPAAFSGGKLHNLSKTVYFLTFLKGENHTLLLETDKTPGIATFDGLQVFTLNPVERLTFDPKIKAEDGDRRPWITFVLDNLPLKSIALSLTYSRRKKDSDDVKIKIDNRIQGSLISTIKHVLWRFVGSLLSISTPTKTETQLFTINQSEGLHYVEVDADRMPTLEKVILDFGKELSFPKDIPTIENPKWTNNFYDDTEVIILARAIYGEAGGESKEAKIGVGWAIRNRVVDSKNRWGKTFHAVILEPLQYEPFNDPNKDVFKKITNPPLDNSLENNAWQDSYESALAIILDQVKDPTMGANHFLSKDLNHLPDWVDQKKLTVEIGNTRFYKL